MNVNRMAKLAGNSTCDNFIYENSSDNKTEKNSSVSNDEW